MSSVSLESLLASRVAYVKSTSYDIKTGVMIMPGEAGSEGPLVYCKGQAGKIRRANRVAFECHMRRQDARWLRKCLC
jgi:hypothetical protein